MLSRVYLLIAALAVASQSQPQSCFKFMDLCFLLDGSASTCASDPTYNRKTNTTCSNWNSTLDFAKNIVTDMAIGSQTTRVGAVTFGTKGERQFNLSRFDEISPLLSAISQLSYPGGYTNTSGGLDVMMNLVLNPTYGDRPDFPDVAIIITNGKPTDPTTVQASIDRVQAAGVKTYAIGVGNQTDLNTLKELASEPKQINVTYFTVANYNSLGQILSVVLEQICNLNFVAPTTSTTTPPATTRAPPTV